MKQPHTSSLEWLFSRLRGQDKAIWKEAIRTIMSQTGTFIRPLGKFTIPVNIKHTLLLLSTTGKFYVKEATDWVRYTS